MFAPVLGFGPLRRVGRILRRNLPSLNFITLHYLYFVVTCLLASIIFWGASTPARSVTYTDALFLTVSAMTLAGLNTINLSTLNTFQQWMLFFLIMIGSAIFVSAFVVHVRKRAFEQRFAYIIAKRRRRAERRSLSSLGRRFSRSRSRPGTRDVERDNRASAGVEDEIHISPACPADTTPSHITFDSRTLDPHHLTSTQRVKRTSSHASIGRHSQINTSRDIAGAQPEAFDSAQNDLTFTTTNGVVSRNSNFHHLSEEERQKLGGYEYRAVCLLSWIVPLYYILFQLFGCIGLGAYVAMNRPATALQNGLNPWWVGAFNAVSAFNNSGMSLLDANMIAFQTSVYMLLTMGLLILAGNTCYPIFLRLIVWTFLKLVPAHDERWADHRKTLQFLLDHPRRCYTNLFPSQHTWWLAACVICLNGIDWLGFEVLNIGNKAIAALPANIRTLDGLFQALAVRSGGFYVVPIPSVRISLQVLYVIMMYISVYPVVITMRHTNVYEERSLGIYPVDEEHCDCPSTDTTTTPSKPAPTTTTKLLPNSYFIRTQLRAQLAHDLWSIVLAVFLITIIEARNFERDPVLYSVFNIIFETVSAYGCVGVSLGVPNDSYSFSGALETGSRLVLCAVMLRGRHRGLPVRIDRAVLLPGDDVGEEEEEEERSRVGVAGG
ncbi:TrkH-domain-containing protein [Periconia macrospinosa]|uniref:TrkH-domain-containing protein n=1 Tax=Periconia macrospinosa TaxID=97972 RepID=A0A2V1ECP6_9PLEO|nr:TrkH-domain-containing protein [Periconia macrospinosa]